MRRIPRIPRIPVLAVLGALIAIPSAVHAAPRLLGVGCLPGTATDMSNQNDTLEDGTPHNRLGGYGSALAYTGSDNLYIATPDRGPADGTTHYVDRFQVFRIEVDGSGRVTPTLVQTALLQTEAGEFLTGSSKAFDAADDSRSLRFDPEGVRIGRNGNLFISDEYGPYLYEFNREGKRVRSFALPAKFAVGKPSAVAGDELPPGNASGRQSNRGMEGLAISPDGTKLYGIMQSPLIQDGGLDAANARKGLNIRILEVDTTSGATREFLYPLDAAGNGVSEIVAVNGQEFLVLERDGRAGTEAAFKKLFKISIAGATDMSSTTLPQTGIPNGVTPVTKSLFLDMLDPAYGLAGANFPEKLEGLEFGPNLPDGRHLLLVSVDNDFVADRPGCFYAFAIDPADLPNFQPQQR
jgi:hypothetical protein